MSTPAVRWGAVEDEPDPTPVVVCPMQPVTFSVKGKRGDPFMAGSKLTRLADEHGWEMYATYTRVRIPRKDRPARYVATMAVRLRRASVYPWRFEHALAYYRTNSKGAYGLEWAAIWLRDGETVRVPVRYVSAKGLAEVLALPVGLTTARWTEATAPHVLVPPAEDEADDGDAGASSSGMSDPPDSVPS